MFKVNVDGASSDQEGSSSVGVVIRDSNGQIMAALCLPLQSHFSVELMEVFALEQGVLFAQELQLPRVIFESDALAVIQAVNDKATGSFYGHLIQGILQNCESFESCHFKYLNRRFNSVVNLEFTKFGRALPLPLFCLFCILIWAVHGFLCPALQALCMALLVCLMKYKSFSKK